MSGRNDYYFGRVYDDAERNEVNLSLNDLIRRGKLSGPEHFTAQLRRLIAQNPQAVVTDGSSNPPFEDFWPVWTCLRLVWSMSVLAKM